MGEMDCDIKLSNCRGIKIRLEGDDVFDAQLVNQSEGITKVLHVPLKMCQINPLDRDKVLLEVGNNISIDPAMVLYPDMVNTINLLPLLEIVVLGAKSQKVLGGHCTDIHPLMSDLLEGLLLGRQARRGRPLGRLWVAKLFGLRFPWGVRTASRATCDTDHKARKRRQEESRQ